MSADIITIVKLLVRTMPNSTTNAPPSAGGFTVYRHNISFSFFIFIFVFNGFAPSEKQLRLRPRQYRRITGQV
jgi:hypothetical protein